MKTAEHKAIEERFEAYFNAVEEIKRIIWTPKDHHAAAAPAGGAGTQEAGS